jgi:hypothetical protein
MHNCTIVRVLTQVILNDFAKGLRIKALINIFYGLMYVFLIGRYTPVHVTITHGGKNNDL